MTSNLEPLSSVVDDLAGLASGSLENGCPVSHQGKEIDFEKVLDVSSIGPANRSASTTDSVSSDDCHTGLT